MVSQEEVIGYVRQVEQPVTIKDIAIGLNLDWNPSSRRIIAKKVDTICKYKILVVVDPNAKTIKVQMNPEDHKSDN